MDPVHVSMMRSAQVCSDDVPFSLVAGRYRIERVLGIGGMGVVYHAEHLLLAERVALKLLHSRYAALPEARARFVREARSQFRIVSPHVVRVLDVGETESGVLFLTMEYVDGASLKDVMRRNDVDVSTACAIGQQICEGLATAHALGIVHRDIKPANVMITTSPSGALCAKVIDFGIAQLDLDASSSRLTATSTVMGTPSYMAPEQLRAARSADERSDVWSVGATLYELLTGRLPYEAESPADLIVAQIQGPPPLASEIQKQVPESLALLVNECFAFESRARRMTVGRLADGLAPFARSSTVDPCAQRANAGPDIALRRRKVRNTAGKTAFEIHEVVRQGGTQSLERAPSMALRQLGNAARVTTPSLSARATRLVSVAAIIGVFAATSIAVLLYSFEKSDSVRRSFSPIVPPSSSSGHGSIASLPTSAAVGAVPHDAPNSLESAAERETTTLGRKAVSSPVPSRSVDPYARRR